MFCICLVELNISYVFCICLVELNISYVCLAVFDMLSLVLFRLKIFLLSCRRAVMNRVFSEAAHHGIVSDSGQPLGREHSSSRCWCLVVSSLIRGSRQDLRDVWRTSAETDDDCLSSLYTPSLHPREQTTPARVSESRICVYNTPSELFK